MKSFQNQMVKGIQAVKVNRKLATTLLEDLLVILAQDLILQETVLLTKAAALQAIPEIAVARLWAEYLAQAVQIQEVDRIQMLATLDQEVAQTQVVEQIQEVIPVIQVERQRLFPDMLEIVEKYSARQ